MLAKQERKKMYGSRARPFTPLEPQSQRLHPSSDVLSHELTRGAICDIEIPSGASAASSTHDGGIRLVVQGKGKGLSWSGAAAGDSAHQNDPPMKICADNNRPGRSENKVKPRDHLDF